MNAKPLKVHIRTFGCQMNLYDTEAAGGFLVKAGYELLPESARPEQNADVIVINTCSVREHAEERVYGQLNALRKFKAEARPDLVIGLMGCMVEEHKEKLFSRFPHLDFLCGTRNIKELPELVESVRKNRRQAARIRRDGIGIEYSEFVRRADGLNAWLPIMTGCNKVCTYCIVPTTRGPEVSMPPREVFREASRLADAGYKQITLLGQNVNSYGKDLPAGEGRATFSDLLRMLNTINGLELISFTTSHPEDATEELFLTLRDCAKISKHFHLPLQSGSNAILKRMKRLHTIEDYQKKVARLRQLVPDVSLTTDIIVGFCGETESDFEATRQALAEIRFEGAFIFKYSPRAQTPAYKLKDDVPNEIKESRHSALLQFQEQISADIRRSLVGTTHETLISGRSRKNPEKLMGQTIQERHVLVAGSPDLIGSKANVRFSSLINKTFSGEFIHHP